MEYRALMKPEPRSAAVTRSASPAFLKAVKTMGTRTKRRSSRESRKLTAGFTEKAEERSERAA